MKNKVLKYRIIESIKFLATPPEKQLSLLPDFVSKPDEIASSLDDWLTLYNNLNTALFSPEDYQKINDLNSMFDTFEDSDFTTEEFLSSNKWKKIRNEARKVLLKLKIEYSEPDSSSI